MVKSFRLSILKKSLQADRGIFALNFHCILSLHIFSLHINSIAVKNHDLSNGILLLAFYDHLRANLADVGELRAHTIKASKGDIGYHIRLRDLSQKGQLDEGDVVGFFEDENHKTVIERYSKENYSRAKLAGVITRSYYLEGLCKEAIRGEFSARRKNRLQR